ncbi:hypothetical protein ACOME3_010773, partial [Neoechinorhynchus agilis]
SRDLVNRTRLAAVSTRESDAWLNTILIASVGTLLSNETVRIGVSLRLGYRCAHLMADDTEQRWNHRDVMVSSAGSQKEGTYDTPK